MQNDTINDTINDTTNNLKPKTGLIALQDTSFPQRIYTYTPNIYTTMHLKIHNISGCDTIVAACDADLIGQTLTCPQCDIVVDESFYGTEPATEEEIIKALKSAANANIIGEKVCAIALKAGIIDKETIILIGNIPHAQIYGV